MFSWVSLLIIRAQHTAQEREKIVADFNNPKSSLQILVSSLRVGATSYNLQKACHYMVIIDVPGSASVLLQAIGRLFRIHQIHPVMCWVLFLEGTYDGKLMSSMCKKYLPIIAGQGAIAVTEGEIDQRCEHEQETGEEEEPISRAEISSDIINEKCAQIFLSIFRHRLSRAIDDFGENRKAQPSSLSSAEQEHRRFLKKQHNGEQVRPSKNLGRDQYLLQEKNKQTVENKQDDKEAGSGKDTEDIDDNGVINKKKHTNGEKVIEEKQKINENIVTNKNTTSDHGVFIEKNKKIEDLGKKNGNNTRDEVDAKGESLGL
ncbi:hypothetical protein MMC27_002619 [Xylographa pallens]|nr:hypothetical protein [Xylographa pallens]